MNDKRIIKILFAITLLLGLTLRFYQYLMGRSLWDDETHLALNFMKYGLVRLLQPLDYIQAAPALFIVLTKAAAEIFGYGELALRAIPFVSSILTFPLIYFITRELTQNRVTALVAFFTFAVNLCVIYFSSELKQYAVELAIYLVMVYLAIGRNGVVVRHRNLLLATAGSISIFLSSTAFIILFCIACNFFLTWYQEKKINREQVKILIPWLFTFLCNYFLFIYHHPATLQQRINYAFAFCPTDVLSHAFVNFLKKTADETFFNLVLYVSKDYGFPYLLLLILFVAIRRIITARQWTVFFLVCLPILIHFALSALKLYPFWYRLILYLVPCFVILMSIGTTLIAEFLKKKVHLVAAALTILYCVFFFTKESFKQFPLWFREIKPSLSYLNDSLPSITHVYITDPAHAYTYYYKRGYVRNNIYKEVPWKIELPEFYDMVSHEKSNYALFYSTLFQWGYGKVLEDLQKRGLIVRTFQYKGYAVSEVRPVEGDTTQAVRIDPSYFDTTFSFKEDNSVAIWTGTITTKPLLLKAGKYRISILSRGTAVNKIYPRNQLFINEQLVGEFSSREGYETVDFLYEAKQDLNATFRLTLLNDTLSAREDRNTFIKSIGIFRR